MPRPTPVQVVYGSATVVLSTLAMLLLSKATSAPAVVLVTLAGLALGLLVALALAGNRYPDTGRLDPEPDGQSAEPPQRVHSPASRTGGRPLSRSTLRG